MGDPRQREREAFEHCFELIPAEPPRLLAAPPQAAEPDESEVLVECVQCAIIVWQPIVDVMTPQDAGIPALLLSHWRMHEPPRLLTHCLQLLRQALALRLVLQDEPAKEEVFPYVA